MENSIKLLNSKKGLNNEKLIAPLFFLGIHKKKYRDENTFKTLVTLKRKRNTLCANIAP